VFEPDGSLSCGNIEKVMRLIYALRLNLIDIGTGRSPLPERWNGFASSELALLKFIWSFTHVSL